jgi:hypothetical protein
MSHHRPDPIRPALRPLAALAFALALTACTGADAPPSADRIALGPTDGHDLPGVDLGRVQPGDTAPDFSLESYGGDIVTLSDYRGTHDVVLVFYRGHW